MKQKSVYNTVKVTVNNLGTGNHCINTDQLINGKDFDFVIGSRHYVMKPCQVMQYINDNKCKTYKHIDTVDEETGRVKHYSFYFYLIKDSYIMDNAYNIF